ncbi:MATE family efflux transporter [Gloeocapsopsis dulcis]|uniref:Probable multidrug resistance protein NorM n=2 Tax=Gloeocapsopsis TaxID=693222 RepID=A0A6N8FTB0_9CHRO|nr:MATE family efflux transporter [Gloeocapsopsis dulcis]MUL35186.1 MATE family efflux transporter [Gloeocapsopsis dulcis AAB1 = 1H9]WNN89073.1 MATE family efflux transporter [Gloeocapsopsis dulcis]
MDSQVFWKSNVTTEIREFLKLAVPLASAQVAQASVGFVDTIMMGHLGAESLAAGGLASTTFQLLLNTTSGIVMAVSPLVAEAYGAEQKTQITQIARQGLWLSLFLSIPMMFAIAQLDTVMLLLGQQAAIVTLTAQYFNFILWGIFPALGFAMLRGYVSALSQAQIVTVIVIIGTLFNIIGNYILGFGKFGFPRMELAGLGLASGLSFWLMFLMFLVYTLNHPQLKEYQFLRKLHRLKPQILKRLIAIGTAIAVTIALEYGLFAVVTFLMGILGTEVLAAHQTVYQTMYLIFMVPLGMSYAVTARVGQWFGQQDFKSARRAGYISITIAAIFMIVTAIALVIYRQQVIGIYLDIHNPANVNVLTLAVPMLIISAVAQLLDGVQRVAMGALYGLQDTRIPMLLSGLAFWGVGLTSGYLLGFPLGLGGVGLWTGQSIGVAVAGVIFVWRFHRLTASCNSVGYDQCDRLPPL